MELDIYQVDAFAARPFEGNPAAIVPLTEWLDTLVMQKIAEENNVSETAFFVKRAEGRYDLRWFTPSVEVPLCGHATLASAWVIFKHLAPALDRVDFATKSGVLTVTRNEDGGLTMDLPSYQTKPHQRAKAFVAALGQAFGKEPLEVFEANYPVAVLATEDDVRTLNPTGLGDALAVLAESGVIVTAKGGASGFDFVSRFFAPGKGVDEDPVTGSAHSALVPFWARRLGKTHLRARQMSARGGTLICDDKGDRVILKGTCAPFLKGVIEI